MTKTIKVTAFVWLLCVAATGLYFTVANNKPLAKPEKAETFILELVVNGLHQMSWDPMDGTAPYSVSILNLTTNTMHSQFSTTST